MILEYITYALSSCVPLKCQTLCSCSLNTRPLKNSTVVSLWSCDSEASVSAFYYRRPSYLFTIQMNLRAEMCISLRSPLNSAQSLQIQDEKQNETVLNQFPINMLFTSWFLLSVSVLLYKCLLAGVKWIGIKIITNPGVLEGILLTNDFKWCWFPLCNNIINNNIINNQTNKQTNNCIIIITIIICIIVAVVIVVAVIKTTTIK